eukprot:1057748-Pleurochrysis_carterae.AAC.1
MRSLTLPCSSTSQILDQMCRKTCGYIGDKSSKLDRLALSLLMCTDEDASEPDKLIEWMHNATSSDVRTAAALEQLGIVHDGGPFARDFK